eukprot:GHVT01095556.1.p1 GENE.GHVT01095556.1~~GHVT01095556.1.p1  ORF type:complete len:355 (+),score=35.85 GHVT01095556.1:1386-2450(+)
MSDEAIRLTTNEVKVLVHLADLPFIVSYRDAFLEELEGSNNLCIVMDYCDGGDLAQAIVRAASTSKWLPEVVLRKWLFQMCIGLKEMHSRKIIHRDMKPSNVFIDAHGDLHIGDFGLSKVLANTFANLATLCGTYAYMAPEHFQGGGYNTPADVWALGCIMYEAASFRYAVHIEESTSLYQLQQAVCGRPMPRFPRKYSKQLQNMCNSMLRKKPKQRPVVDELLHDLYFKDEWATFDYGRRLRRPDTPAPKSEHNTSNVAAMFKQSDRTPEKTNQNKPKQTKKANQEKSAAAADLKIVKTNYPIKTDKNTFASKYLEPAAKQNSVKTKRRKNTAKVNQVKTKKGKTSLKKRHRG